MLLKAQESYNTCAYTLGWGIADLSKPCGRLICVDTRTIIPDSPPWCELSRSQNVLTQAATLGKLSSAFITTTGHRNVSRETSLGHEDTDWLIRQWEGLRRTFTKGMGKRDTNQSAHNQPRSVRWKDMIDAPTPIPESSSRTPPKHITSPLCQFQSLITYKLSRFYIAGFELLSFPLSFYPSKLRRPPWGGALH